MARALLARHLARRPADNPVSRFGERFAARPAVDHEAKGSPHYHAWAFATVRQLGAAFELAALHVGGSTTRCSRPRPRRSTTISQTAKAFILKAARAVNAKRPLDARPMFDEMAAAWQAGTGTLAANLR